jgi:hypothetical protein
MKKVIDWFKGNWFLWVFLILFYIGLRISGYDIKIEKKGELDQEIDWSKYKPAE